jgi:chemotaxis methyl-accepting protein methylase
MSTRLPPRAGAGPDFAADDTELAALKQKIQRERGLKSEFYKSKCLHRRISVRMRARGRTSFSSYAALLDDDPHEYDVLLDTLTINVTKFFRNTETWEAIERDVVPALFETAAREPGMRRQKLWSAGSASGEEAYSLSMLLHEHAERHGAEGLLGRFQIVGTDIDRRSLEAAGAGVYPELSFAETSAARQARWFEGAAPPLRLRDEARRNVRFDRLDLISDEYDTGYALILCRNVLIYFDREIQERLFERFYEALRPGGFLVLGKVETMLGPARARFRAINHRERIFRRPD